VLIAALESGACDTLVLDEEAAGTAQAWSKLAAFRTLLIRGSALEDARGQQARRPRCGTPGRPQRAAVAPKPATSYPPLASRPCGGLLPTAVCRDRCTRLYDFAQYPSSVKLASRSALPAWPANATRQAVRLPTQHAFKHRRKEPCAAEP